ncbi:MAG: hypothetical protein QM756_41440 [Polyangiaceae bacterium]
MRVRFGERSPDEQRKFEAFDAALQRVFDAALTKPRSASWWRREMRGLLPGLDAEPWAEQVVVRSPQRRLWPLVDYIVARAPQSLSLIGGRPALPFERALGAVGERAKAFAKAGARAGFSRGHLLEVVINLPGGAGNDEEQGLGEALVWGLLGERLAEAWIGAVKVAPAPRGGALRVVSGSSDEASRFALSELGSATHAAIEGLRQGLSPEPHWARNDGSEWTLFELEPEDAEDWPDEDDLVMATTCVPELLKCRLSKQPFSSQRFSRHAELFVHLKYESSGSPERRLAARRDLEDALDGALVPARAGRVVGAGLGLRYSYVLLALVEPERTLPLAAQLAQRAQLPRQSWLLPLDSDLVAEWHGVWPESPAPLIAGD